MIGLQNLGKLKACLNYFGIENMNKFENRFKVQKYIFFAQETGLYMGFGYNLYMKGPYSPALAAAAFSIFGEEKEIECEKLTTEEKKILERVKKILQNLDEMGLEILATMAFIVTRSFTKPNRDEVEKKLYNLKEWTKEVPREKMDKYWKILHELFPEKFS